MEYRLPDIGVQCLLRDPTLPGPSAETFVPPVNHPQWVKPLHGGLWTSTYQGPDKISDWAEWCRSERVRCGERRLWVLNPKLDVRMITIDHYEDLVRLLDRPEQRLYQETVEPVLRNSKFFSFIDFEALAAQGVDGVHLTENGQWSTRFSMPGLYGWDSESTCWLRWAFDEVQDGGIVKIEERED